LLGEGCRHTPGHHKARQVAYMPSQLYASDATRPVITRRTSISVYQNAKYEIVTSRLRPTSSLVSKALWSCTSALLKSLHHNQQL